MNCFKKSRGREDTEIRSTDYLPPKQSACNRVCHDSVVSWERSKHLPQPNRPLSSCGKGLRVGSRTGAGSRRHATISKTFAIPGDGDPSQQPSAFKIGQWRVCDMHMVPFSAIIEEPLRCQPWKCDSGQSASSRKHRLDGATCPLDIPGMTFRNPKP